MTLGMRILSTLLLAAISFGAADPLPATIPAAQLTLRQAAGNRPLTQRTFGPNCAATTSLDISGLHDGDLAGLGALQKKYGFVAVNREGDSNRIIMVSAESDKAVELASIPLHQNTLYLKLACDFRNRADIARFFYSLDNQKWSAIGQPLHMVYTLPHFMGYRFALFHYATKSSGGTADFDYFRIVPE